jgi:drug/metabolite transporter (DMT)-like permease
LGVVLGGLSSLLYGLGDFLGGEGAKRVSAPTVVMWAGAVSFPLIAVVALVVGGSATSGDLWLGGAAGTVGALGLVALFAGLGRGHAAAVAPAAAAVGGVVPVAYAVIGGESLNGLTWLGVVVALPAIVLCSWVRDPADVPLGGLWYGVLAGVGFGVYAVLMDRTSATSGLLPLIPARAATMLTVVAVGLVGVWRISEPRRVPRLIVAGNGVLDVSGNVALLLALRAGSLAPVAIAASFYPAITVLLARMFNHEPIRAHQTAGLALTVVALAAIAVG